MNLALQIFETPSELHINMLKSIIYLVTEMQNLDLLAEIHYCEIGSFPTIGFKVNLGVV